MKDKYLEARKYLKKAKKEDIDFWKFFDPDDFTEDELNKLLSLAEHLGFRDLYNDLDGMLLRLAEWQDFIKSLNKWGDD